MSGRIGPTLPVCPIHRGIPVSLVSYKRIELSEGIDAFDVGAIENCQIKDRVKFEKGKRFQGSVLVMTMEKNVLAGCSEAGISRSSIKENPSATTKG